VAEAIEKVSPNGSTPTGARTQTILGAHLDKLNAAKGTPAYGQIKPLDLICITDGEPSAFYLPISTLHCLFTTIR
jgi:hypothetical protein